jgi:hypothetical protein
MANVTVDQVLERVQSFHEQLAGSYADLQDRGADARVRLLAGCMAGREARLSRALQGYRRDPANAATLRAWFKVDPLPRELGVEDLALAPEMTTDQLCAVGLTADRRLGEFVERVAEAASLPRIKDLFADLAAQEEAEQRQTARATLEVEREL